MDVRLAVPCHRPVKKIAADAIAVIKSPAWERVTLEAYDLHSNLTHIVGTSVESNGITLWIATRLLFLPEKWISRFCQIPSIHILTDFPCQVNEVRDQRHKLCVRKSSVGQLVYKGMGGWGNGEMGVWGHLFSGMSLIT